MAKLATIIAMLALAPPSLCVGQDLQSPRRLDIERAELTRLMEEYEGVAESTAYSDVLREEARSQAELIGQRLTDGDFRAGGHIALSIEVDGVAPWDTLTIEAGPAVNVPTLGVISLGGVLRSELGAHLTTEVGLYLQAPKVQARALIQVSIVGVGQPGFRTFATDLPLSEAIMLAGGPGAGADPGQIQIDRGRDVLWSVDELAEPVANGATLDELGIQAGDRIILALDAAPTPGGSGALSRLWQSVSYFLIPTLLSVIFR